MDDLEDIFNDWDDDENYLDDKELYNLCRYFYRKYSQDFYGNKDEDFRVSVISDSFMMYRNLENLGKIDIDISKMYVSMIVKQIIFKRC